MHHVSITSQKIKAAFHCLTFEAGFLDPATAIYLDVIFSGLVIIYTLVYNIFLEK